MSDDGDLTAQALFSPEPTAAARARTFVRDRLRSWGVPAGTVDDAVLLTSELVANAVQHAGTDLEVTCRLAAATIEVLVTDRHPARMLPDMPAAAEDNVSERGRGLTLPAALASLWGVTYAGATKTVWFSLTAAGSTVPGGIVPGGMPGGMVPGGMVAAGSAGEVRREPRHGELSQRELGNLRFGELVRHTVEAARDAVGADAAYALVADEEGELRVRAAVGVAVPEELTTPAGTIVLSAGAGSRHQARSQMSVPFLVDGRVTGVLGVGAAERGAFGAKDEQRLQEVADRVSMSLERLRLSELERDRRGRVAFLAEASELLSTTLDARQAIALTAQIVVPRLAAWCAVFLADEAGAPRPAYVWHEDEGRIDALSRLLGEVTPPALASVMTRPGHSWSLVVPPGADPDAARVASDSAWWFPLAARGRALGAVVLGRPREDRRWQYPPPREALELAEDLTRRAALALDNARLYERQRTTSQALQHSLLPPELPSIPRVELAAEYAAAGEANEVGGDFYDVFPAGDGHWRFAIGDVCGTGPEAAAVTGLARHTLRILADEGHGIAEVVSRLNRLILREGPRGRFITLLHGEIRVPASRPSGSSGPSGPSELPEPLGLSLVCAGHPPPLLLRASGSGQPRPAAQSQMLLGVADDASFGAQETEFFPGDVLLCVTDGVTERRDDAGRLLDDDDGLTAVLATCRGLSAWSVASRIQQAVEDFGSQPPSDDMAVLVLRAIGR